MEGVRDLPVSHDVLRDVAAARGVCGRTEPRDRPRSGCGLGT